MKHEFSNSLPFYLVKTTGMMMHSTVLLTVILTSVLIFQGTISSEEEVKPYQFIRVIPSNIEEVVSLNVLEEIYEEENKVVFLRSAGPPGAPTDIVIEGYSFDIFTEDLESAGIPYSVENVEEKLVEKLRKQRDVSGVEYDHTRYHTYNEITTWLKTLVERHEHIASLFTIGKTFEGRDMYVIKITSDTGGKQKPGIWIDGGIHAREKISPATAVFIIQQMLEQYGNTEIVTELVDGIVWYFLPVFNIDGYEYAMIPMENVTSIREYFNSLGKPDLQSPSWEKLRWRGTRSVYENISCSVDPNRNWDFKWQASPPNIIWENFTFCSPVYPGPEAFSEVEVRNVANFLLEHPYIDATVSMHSYGQLFLFPWCWTTDKPKHYDEFKKLAEKASNAITNVYGTNYTYGSVSELFGVVYGCSCDWTYRVAGITYSFGMELRDSGVYRFFLPEDQIEPTGIETFEGIKEIAKHLISLDRNEAASSLPSLPIWMLTRLCFIALCTAVCYRA